MESAAVESAKNAAGNGIMKPGATLPASDILPLTTNEGERLLRIISQTWRIKRHYELFQLLQGEVQHFIPHQILISAWGDFRGSNLEVDVISAIPGVRTGCLDGCNVGSLLKKLHARWLAQGRQPVLISNTADEGLALSGCECALHKSLRGMSSIMVHGVHDARDGTDSLYLAAHAGPIMKRENIESFRLRVDPIISQIDVAFRRVAGLKSRLAAAFEEPALSCRLLSAREEEILTWVSEGRTNIEISKILCISTFTVKNHVQRIIKKLGAANRTGAVAKYRQLARGAVRQMGLRARKATARREAALVAD